METREGFASAHNDTVIRPTFDEHCSVDEGIGSRRTSGAQGSDVAPLSEVRGDLVGAHATESQGVGMERACKLHFRHVHVAHRRATHECQVRKVGRRKLSRLECFAQSHDAHEGSARGDIRGSLHSFGQFGIAHGHFSHGKWVLCGEMTRRGDATSPRLEGLQCGVYSDA